MEPPKPCGAACLFAVMVRLDISVLELSLSQVLRGPVAGLGAITHFPGPLLGAAGSVLCCPQLRAVLQGLLWSVC